MSYRLLTGRYVIRYRENASGGPQPDGDTLKFQPDSPGIVAELADAVRVEPKMSTRHRISVRMEAIDALESHFDGAHQDLTLADAARDRMLALCGFRDVSFDDEGRVLGANADELPGWVLSNGIEENGRLVAFAFTGDPVAADGDVVEPEQSLIASSVNMTLLDEGLVYPMLYSTLPTGFRSMMVQSAQRARSRQLGVWARGTADPERAADVSDGASALAELVMWPKLFRRLVRYFAVGHRDLTRFPAWLTANPVERNDGLELPGGQSVRLSDVLEVTATTVRLVQWPEDLVVLPRRAVVRPQPQVPSPQVPSPQVPSPQVPSPQVPSPQVPQVPQVPGAGQPGGTSPGRVAARVRLVAALIDPWGPDAGNETVTLLNASEGEVDLTGWTVGDRNGDADALRGTLAAGEASRFRLSRVQLGNGGDSIVLRDADGAEVDRVAYAAGEVPARGRSLVF